MATAAPPALDDPRPLARDAIFRIASLTKPIAAAGAMALVDDGTLALQDPVERYLPELAGRRVLRRLDGALDDTVPAQRAITVEDPLTLRLGFGATMEPLDGSPIQDAEAELGLMTPWAPPPLTPEQWIARFALRDQPGGGWRYNAGLKVLGCLPERITGQRLEACLRSRLFDPLGMVDTGFSVPAGSQARVTTAYAPDETTGEVTLLDPPVGGWWNARRRWRTRPACWCPRSTTCGRSSGCCARGGATKGWPSCRQRRSRR